MMFSPLFFSSYLHLLEPAALYWASPPQLVHAWLPARENLPAWQGVAVELPSQAIPAGHCEHDWRSLGPVPPLVYSPAPHIVHSFAPAEEKRESEPQLRQLSLPSGEYCPAPHTAEPLVPSQERPTGHGEQVVLVLPSAAPPLVMEPAVHVEQDAAPALLCILSNPQSTHAALPAVLFRPAGQLWGTLSPLGHMNPAMHVAHPVWVVLPPPVV